MKNSLELNEIFQREYRILRQFGSIFPKSIYYSTFISTSDYRAPANMLSKQFKKRLGGFLF